MQIDRGSPRLTTYTRVIPRDLFNEAKLLKCLGRLSLLILDGLSPHKDLTCTQKDVDRFLIEQRESDGALHVTNVEVSIGDHPITIYSHYNSKEDWPLFFEDDSVGEEFPVFDDAGYFSEDFVNYVERKVTS